MTNLFEVGVADSIASIGQGHAARVGAVLLDQVVQSQKVARRLAHLLAVQHQVSVGADSPRPVLGREDGQMAIYEEGEMVG